MSTSLRRVKFCSGFVRIAVVVLGDSPWGDSPLAAVRPCAKGQSLSGQSPALWGQSPDLRSCQGRISIGVPSGTICHSASISALEAAMQPSVQSPGRRPNGSQLGCPWMKIAPPGERPRAAA